MSIKYNIIRFSGVDKTPNDFNISASIEFDEIY